MNCTAKEAVAFTPAQAVETTIRGIVIGWELETTPIGDGLGVVRHLHGAEWVILELENGDRVRIPADQQVHLR